MAKRNKLSKKSWGEGVRIEVSVNPPSEVEPEVAEKEVVKSSDSSAPEPKSSKVSKSRETSDKKFRHVRVLKSLNEERREITCVAMVANELDAHNHVFTPGAVKGASEGFITNFNISKSIGLDHSGERPDVDLIGNWYVEEAGVIDGFEYPANCWLTKMKINDDDVWESIKADERTGTSIEGLATGYEVSDEEESN